MHIFRAQLLCKRSVHRYCAHYGARLRPDSSSAPPRRRRRQPSGSTPRACGCSPTRCARACSGRCGAVARPRPPTSRPSSAPTPGATTYHLRKLESVGLVRDTEEGEGKRRLWRAATDFHSYHPSDFEGDEDAETALNWLTRDYARHFTEQSDGGSTSRPTWPTDWQDACGSSDDTILVTAEQLRRCATRSGT